MVGQVLMTQQVSTVKDLVSFISDNGIMMVISGVVIYFLIKVLNSLLDQNNQVIQQILPQINDIQDTLTDMLVRYNEAESRRLLSVNKQFSEVQTLEKDIMNKIKLVNKELTSINHSLAELVTEIEKQHVYMDFYQEQLKKEKGTH